MNRRDAVIAVVVAMVAAASVGAAISYSTPTESPTLTTNSNVSVTLSGSHDLSPSETGFPDDETVEVASNNGNVTVSGSSDANLTITQITGTETQVESLNVSGAPVTIDPEDKPAATVEGETATLDFREMALDDGTVDFSYSGSSGETTLTVRGLPADQVVAARDSTGLLDKATTDSNGVATFSLPNSEHDVTLASSSVSDPQLSDADPVGTQSTTPNELAVNVTDPDFPGDEVQVNISLDGSQQTSQNITGATRVTTSIGSISPGTHTWTVEATDSEGGVTTQTYEFGVPANISVYNESRPNELLNQTTINATVYSQGDEVFSRSTTDGNFSLEGLPASEDLVIELNAANFSKRTVIVEDIAQQQRFYLLPDDENSVDVRFQLDDPTGEFPSADSQLYIKRPLTVDGNTTYQTIAADEFGANGYVETLESDVRYRLVLKNADNDVRVLGAYSAPTSETVTLRPNSLELEFPENGGYNWNFTYDNSTGSPELRFQFADPQNETRNLRITIHEQGNTSNTLSGYPVTYEGPLGTVSISEPLTAEQANTTWTVEWEADRNGNTIDSSQRVSARPDLFNELPTWVQLWGSMGVILMTGGLFSRANLAAGAVTVGLTAGIFWWIGFLGSAATGIGVAIGLAIGVIVWASQKGGGL